MSELPLELPAETTLRQPLPSAEDASVAAEVKHRDVPVPTGRAIGHVAVPRLQPQTAVDMGPRRTPPKGKKSRSW